MERPTLEDYLKQKFSTSLGKKSHGAELAEAMIGRSLGGASFEVPEAFDLKVVASEEEMKIAIQDFYLGYGYELSSERNVSMKHFGADLSFENRDEKVFVIVSPFDTYFKISITLIKK